MDSEWASERLQVIRTLMERSALYRRALAPTSLITGALGLGAAVVGWIAEIRSPIGFGVYWMAVALAAIGGALLVIRGQALRAAEPIWSSPTRRIAMAMSPALFVGMIAGLVAIVPEWRTAAHAWWLPSVWMVLYGCAVYSAGFFMPRGIKLFGWAFIISGSASLFGVSRSVHDGALPELIYAHLVMGGAFGVLHLFYGLYLYLTETSDDAYRGELEA